MALLRATITRTIPSLSIAAGQHTTTAEGDTITVQATAIIIDVDTATIIESANKSIQPPKKTMSLFDAVLASLNDPSRATQQSDLERWSSAFGGGGASSTDADQIASLIGGFLKPVLQEQHAIGGAQGVDTFLQDIKQSSGSPDQLRQVLGADRVDQMVGRAEQKTGLDANTIFRLLPIVLPAVIGLLQSGRTTAVPARHGSDARDGRTGGGQTNPILAQFLDSDGDGDVDMADIVRLTSRFLQK